MKRLLIVLVAVMVAFGVGQWVRYVPVVPERVQCTSHFAKSDEGRPFVAYNYMYGQDSPIETQGKVKRVNCNSKQVTLSFGGIDTILPADHTIKGFEFLDNPEN